MYSLVTEDNVRLYVGTSGYSYKEWKGNFYPKELAAKEMAGDQV